MQTTWGDLEIWDAHVHFFSRPFFQALARQAGVTLEEAGARLHMQVPGEDATELAGQWTAELDRQGVAGCSLIASLHGDEGSVIAAVGHARRRFLGYLMLNPAADDALDRLRAALASGRVHAVCLFPAMHAYPLHDPRVSAVIETVAAHGGVAVFVHCGALTVGVRKKLGLRSPFDMRYSNPIDLHPLALRFPGVNFVVPHFGAGYLREALMLADLCGNVYLDTSSSNSWIRYQPGELDLARVFRQALDVVGAGRLLFGTDSSFFPRGWNREVFDTQVAALQAAGAGAADARLVLGGNLCRLAGIS